MIGVSYYPVCSQGIPHDIQMEINYRIVFVSTGGNFTKREDEI